MNSKDKRKAVILQSASMLIFSTTGIFRRFVPMPSSLLAFCRGLLGAAFITIFRSVAGNGLSEKMNKRQFLWAVATGSLMGINWIMLFEAFHYTTVSVATLCNYMQPTIVTLLSPILFKEKLTGRKLTCALISVMGMVLVSGVITGDTLPETNALGIAFGLGSAVFYSSVAIMNKLKPEGDVFIKSQVQLISASLFVLPYVLLSGAFGEVELFTFKAVVCFLFIGLFNTGVAYVLYFSSIAKLEAQTIAALSYVDPVSALFLAIIFLNEPLRLSCIAGAVMILSATALSQNLLISSKTS